MVKAYNQPGIRHTKRFTGIMHTAILEGGSVIYKAWPPKRGKTAPGPVADMRQAFGWACRASVWAIAEDRIFAETITKGSMYYPRDALISAMYGTLITIYKTDGGRVYSARKVDKNAQFILDAVSNIPGTMLYRTTAGWVGVAGGGAGDVLQYNGLDLIPTWVPPSGGGGGAFDISVKIPPRPNPEEGTTFGNNAVGAKIFFPELASSITGVKALMHSVPSGGHLQAGLYQPATGNAIAGSTLLASSPPIPAVAGSIVSLPFTAPHAVNKDAPYFIVLGLYGSAAFQVAQTDANTPGFYFSGTTLPSTIGSAIQANGYNYPFWAY